MNFSGRRRRIRQAIEREGVEALLVSHLPDVRYLTGFTGSAGVLALGRGGAALFTDSRYAEQARAEAAGVRVVITPKSPAIVACGWMEGKGVTRCGFDPAHTSVAALEAMRAALSKGLRRRFFVGVPPLVARAREVKSEAEIEAMRAAALLGCRLFEEVLNEIRPGVPEVEIAASLEYAARRAGAEAMSFETIVASGARSALPHGRATAAKLPRRGFVTLDFGVLLEGYCSDMTRTVHLGRLSGEEWEVYDSVLTAQRAAVEAITPGATCASVDGAARSVLDAAGLAKYFTHSTGHGVGLEIHEGPRVAQRQEQGLERGMIVTVEPGVYLPARFGVRIEDMVLVTGDGHEVLTPVTKALIEL